jgi:Ca2+/Na+ antiporter
MATNERSDDARCKGLWFMRSVAVILTALGLVNLVLLDQTSALPSLGMFLALYAYFEIIAYRRQRNPTARRPLTRWERIPHPSGRRRLTPRPVRLVVLCVAVVFIGGTGVFILVSLVVFAALGRWRPIPGVILLVALCAVYVAFGVNRIRSLRAEPSQRNQPLDGE